MVETISGFNRIKLMPVHKEGRLYVKGKSSEHHL
jgi:hypothetical protein